MPRRVATTLLQVTLAWLPATQASAQKFLPDDPILRDHDDLPIDLPGEIELATAYDVIEHTFQHRPKGAIPPAQNVNTLGEVPDSAWWTNRIGVRELTLEEIVRGPNRDAGPDMSQPWTVIRGKSGGITPGFTMRDVHGEIYFVKFDPPQHFGLSTGADVIGSKLFHAMGYSVPETWIVYFREEQLRVGQGAMVRVRGGKPRQLLQADLDAMMARVARLPDGRVRCVASRALPGRVVGPHKYFGTRPDDANDVIPHEHRRELRGYRVFCAWLNHDDSRSLNSLASYVEKGDKGYLVHYLQDFSSILGSGSDWRREIGPQNPRAGNEYVLELAPLAKTAFSLGLWERPWHRARYRAFPQVGAIEADMFDPEAWKPEYPNPAFERMLPEDAFWAARIVSRFSDSHLRGIVQQADLRAPQAEEHLIAMIGKRRDKVLARYFRSVNPLADFSVTGGPHEPGLAFVNLGEDSGLGRVEGYESQWFAFDNEGGGTQALAPPSLAEARWLPLPPGRPAYLMVRIRTLASGLEAWGKRVDVYLRTAPELAIVGIERES